LEARRRGTTVLETGDPNHSLLVSPSEYVASFFLVIIGFAVSEVLRGSARLIRERHLIKFYWPYLLVIPLVFELLIFGFMWIFTLVKSGTDPVWSLLDVAARR
jgi:hypothetical protein